MPLAVVTMTGNSVDVLIPRPAVEGGEEEHAAEVPESDLNPIAPELKEMAWGFGSFVLFALLMRFFLYPRLKAGTDARRQALRAGHDDAARITEGARSDVAAYETQLAAVKAEAQQRVDAARATLEAERAERLAAVNARIAERRAAAAAEMEAARAAARGEVESAVRTVAARAGHLATGQAPDDGVVADAVAAVMSAGVTR